MGTVLPSRVSESVRKTKKEYPEKKLIVHYMQPHFPYISLGSPKNPKSKNPESRNTLSRSFRDFFGSRIRKSLGGKLTRKIVRILGIGPINPMHEVLHESGEDKLNKAYRENLRIVLESISGLLETISGNIIVTSDHGEYLGEDGFYGHSYLPDHPVLTTVPWLRIERNTT